MGLLTNPNTNQGKFTLILVKYHNWLCFLLYLIGIFWFLSLAYEPISSATYFSENALLPGLVKNEFNLERETRKYYDELLDEQKRYESTIPMPWLLAKFQQIGLDTYKHNFVLEYTLGKRKNFTGQNIYGILRAPRAASTEALVLSAPYRAPISAFTNTAFSIALILSFAQYCKSQKYWAKDLIFLITEHEQLGTEAWLEAYLGLNEFGGKRSNLIAGDLKGRAGAIQAAINLELNEFYSGFIDVKVEGLNGQLPNLDLFNLAVKLTFKEGLGVSFKQRFWKFKTDPFENYLYNLETLFEMVTTQATGVPNGNHGLYHRYGIQAITLETHSYSSKKVNNKVQDYDVIRTFGYLLEGIFRSLNNLLERFHQSYFLYLLLNTQRFVSIAYYIPSVGCIIAALLIKSCALWLTIKSRPLQKVFDELESNDTEQTKTNKDKSLFYLAEHKVPNLEMLKIQTIFLFAYLFGFVLYEIPEKIVDVFNTRFDFFNFNTDKSIYYGYGALTLMSVFSLALVKLIKDLKAAIYLQIASLLIFATILIVTSVYNFSLAFCVAAIYAPVTLLITIAPKRKLYQYLQRMLWFIFHPFLIVTIIIVGYNMISTYLKQTKNDIDDPISLFQILFNGLEATQRAFVFAIVDSKIYYNFMFLQICIGFIPIWLCIWSVLFVNDVQVKKLKSD